MHSERATKLRGPAGSKQKKKTTTGIFDGVSLSCSE